MSLVGYRECACGHRVLAVVTEVPAPRIGDKPHAEYAEMPPRLQQLRRPLTLRADQKAYDKHLGPRRRPNGDSRKLRFWLRGDAIPLAPLLFTARLCLIQPARIRRAANAWRGGKSDRALDEFPLCGSGPNTRPSLAGMGGPSTAAANSGPWWLPY